MRNKTYRRYPKIGCYVIIKTVLNAFEYGLHCNDMNHKDLEHDSSSAMDTFDKQNVLTVHDWNPLYEDQYGTHEKTH